MRRGGVVSHDRRGQGEEMQRWLVIGVGSAKVLRLSGQLERARIAFL